MKKCNWFTTACLMLMSFMAGSITVVALQTMEENRKENNKHDGSIEEFDAEEAFAEFDENECYN